MTTTATDPAQPAKTDPAPLAARDTDPAPLAAATDTGRATGGPLIDPVTTGPTGPGAVGTPGRGGGWG